VGVVDRIITDLAVMDVTPHGLKVVEMAPGVTREELQAKTGVPLQLRPTPRCARMRWRAAYFYRADGRPHPVGHRLRNPALAACCAPSRRRAARAAHGPVATDMVARVRGHPANPGRLTRPTWPATSRGCASRCAPTGAHAGASAACRRRRRATWR
jgi:hypothetical protein